MATDESAPDAKPPPSKELAIVAKIRDFHSAHPNQTNYWIETEVEAAAFLVAIAMTIDARFEQMSHPMPLENDGMDDFRKRRNKEEREQLRKIRNTFKRKATQGMALKWCIEELGEQQFMGMTVKFRELVN